MKNLKTFLLGSLLSLTFINVQADHHGKKDIVDTAVKAGSFKTLVAAVKAAGLVDTLKGKGPFTVFAPTDEAFAKLPKGTVESLLKPENKAKLADILEYHVVKGAVHAAEGYARSTGKIGDLDTVRLQSLSGVSLTREVGTPLFSAPELLLGGWRYDQSVDVWSLGCVLACLQYECSLPYPPELCSDQGFLARVAAGGGGTGTGGCSAVATPVCGVAGLVRL